MFIQAQKKKHQSSASLAFERGIHRGPVNSPHKWPVMRKMFPFDDVIMVIINIKMPNGIVALLFSNILLYFELLITHVLIFSYICLYDNCRY